MSCGKLGTPDTPKLDASKLPVGLNMPKGMDVDGLKAKAENPGFSDRLKNAGAAIGENIKNTVNKFNPGAIATAAKDAVTGMVGDIKAGISHMADGLTSLKDKIAGFDPKAALDNALPDSPKGALKDLFGKCDAQADSFKNQASSLMKDCNKKGLSAAGKMAKTGNDAGKKALNGVSIADRIEMAKSPDFKAQKIESMSAEAEADVVAKVEADAKGTNPDEKSVQEDLHSESLPIRMGVDSGDCTNYIKTQMIHHAANLVYNSILAPSQGLHCSYSLRNNPKTIFGNYKDESWIACEILRVIETAANLRARGCVMKAWHHAWKEFCTDGLPEGDSEIFPGMGYHGYMNSAWKSIYSMEEDPAASYKLPSGVWSKYQPAYGSLRADTYQKRFWEYMADPSAYVDKYLVPAYDLTASHEDPFYGGATTGPGGFWLHHNTSSKAGVWGSSYVRSLKGKTPMDTFQDRITNDSRELGDTGSSLSDQTTMDFLGLFNKQAKNRFLSGTMNVIAEEVGMADLVEDEVMDNDIAKKIRDNFDNPGWFVTDVLVAQYRKGRKLWPEAFIVGVHFDYATCNITSIEYLGDNEILKEFIK